MEAISFDIILFDKCFKCSIFVHHILKLIHHLGNNFNLTEIELTLLGFTFDIVYSGFLRLKNNFSFRKHVYAEVLILSLEILTNDRYVMHIYWNYLGPSQLSAVVHNSDFKKNFFSNRNLYFHLIWMNLLLWMRL